MPHSCLDTMVYTQRPGGASVARASAALLCVLLTLGAVGPVEAAKARAAKKRPVVAKQDSREAVHARAIAAYESGEFEAASLLFRTELSQLKLQERDGPIERSAREQLVLSEYLCGRVDEAKREYVVLRGKFPEQRFNRNEVLPEVIDDLEAALPAPPAAQPQQPQAEEAPAVVTGTAAPPAPSAPADAATSVSPSAAATVAAPTMGPPSAQSAVGDGGPRAEVVIRTADPEPAWRWYYLTPLGIGQFAAGSPVRGSLLLLAQLGAVATNVAGAVLLAQNTLPDGTVNDLRAAQTAQILVNVGFGAIIGSVVLGLIDGAFFEP